MTATETPPVTVDPVASPREAVTGIACDIVSRATAMGWKGKTADARALEIACGALSCSVHALGAFHPVTHALSLFATLVSVRGMFHVRETAARGA